MIGNADDAARAFRAYDEGDMSLILSTDGTSRVVYLINGVVYKVNRGTYNCNFDEYSNFVNWANLLPDNVRIPAMTLYRIGDDDVLACEYVEGTPTGDCSGLWTGTGCEDDGMCIPNTLAIALTDIGWSDAGWGNAIVRDGIYFLVDVGE